jgi:preprotein translocase subunit SecE
MKAAAEAGKMDKVEGGKPAWITNGIGWGPRKFGELKSFFSEVKSELKKVTWPSWKEVKATTVVVILTTIFFGFYLYGLDIVMSQVFTRVLGGLR